MIHDLWGKEVCLFLKGTDCSFPCLGGLLFCGVINIRLKYKFHKPDQALSALAGLGFCEFHSVAFFPEFAEGADRRGGKSVHCFSS